MEGAGHGGGARAGRATASRSAGSAPTVGPAIGRYHVVKLLGEGAMGRVYLARDPELGREVAIKVLRLDAAGSARDAYIARFRNEARAAARFNHPNVVGVHDAGVDPQLGPYLVYEYIAGPTLRARIQKSRLDAPELVAIARGVAAALDALHAAEILHRDIKPDNILLAPNGGVKLTDFGIARLPDAQLTRDGQFLGTPAYASPEAITRGEYSVRGDVFSLAAVLYEALCGIRPFPGEDAVAVSYSVANDTPLPASAHVPEVPPGVDAAFARALAKRASERFTSAGDLAGALYNAFRAGAKVASASSTEGSEAARPSAPASAASAGSAKRPQHVPRDASRRESQPPRANTHKNPAVPLRDEGGVERPRGRASVDASAERLRGPAIVLALVLLALAFVIARRYARSDEAPAAESPSADASAASPSAHGPAGGDEPAHATAAPRTGPRGRVRRAP